MKTKEFIKKVKELGFEIAIDFTETDKVFDITFKDDFIAYISETCVFAFSTIDSDFIKLSEEIKKELFELLIKYASTPIDERGEEIEEIELVIKENEITPIEKAIFKSFQNTSVEQNIKIFVTDLEQTLATMILKTIKPVYKQKLNSSIFVEPSKNNLLMNITIKSGKNVHIQVFENTGYRPDQFNKGNDSNLLLLKEIQEEQTEPLYEFKTEIYEKNRVLKHTKPISKINMDTMTLKSKKHFVNFMKYTVLGIEME